MNAPNWEPPKCPLTGEWIKQPWYIQILEYYSEWNNREKITGSCNNVDECQMLLAKWKKPESKDCILCGSNYMTCWKMQKLQEQISGCWELNGWDGVPNWELKKQFEGFSGGAENWSDLDKGEGLTSCLCSTHCSVHPKLNLHILRRWVKSWRVSRLNVGSKIKWHLSVHFLT